MMELTLARAELESVLEKKQQLEERIAALDANNTKVISRQVFESLSGKEATEFFKSGGKVVELD